MKQIFSLSLLVLALTCYQCAPAPQTSEQNALVQQAIASQLQTYRNTRQRQCYEAALERANTITDSLILARARAPQDTFLSKTQKPTRPKVQSTLDTTPVRPLIER